MSKIFKLEITTTVLVAADSLQEANQRLGAMSIDEIADEMDSGDMIGGESRSDVIEIPRDEVEFELQAVGNDGSFFDFDELQVD